MSKALSGFRRLLKTSRSAFNGDIPAVEAARIQLKAEFLKHKDVRDEAQLRELYKGIEEVDEMLRFNIVQGTLNKRGNYDVNLSMENKVTIEAGNVNPTGSDFEPIDPSLGQGKVPVEKVKGSGKKTPFEPVVD